MPLATETTSEPPEEAPNSAQLSAELAASEDRYRSLFLQEQRRARHLSLINEVQKCALATREIRPFLPQVTRAIASHFPDCDVAFYMARSLSLGLWQSVEEQQELDDNDRVWRVSDWEGDGQDYEMIVVASYGKYDLRPPVGQYLLLEDIGEDGELAAPGARSALTIPISLEGETIGLISVQSPESDVLDARDVAALHTAGAIIAAHIQNSRLFRHMNEVNAFNQSLLDSMLHSMMVVDDKGLIQFVNARLLSIADKTRAELRRQPLETIFGETPAYHHNLRGAIQQVLETGKGQEVPEVHIWTPEGPQIFDLRLFRVFFRGQAETAILLINLTERWRKTYQLQLTHEIGRLFQESLDINRVLSTILTCITAGTALGFNRGFVFLLDENGTHLEGRMALGPSSPEEAGRIWGEISQRELSLEEILDASESTAAPLTPLQERTAKLAIRIDNPCFPQLKRALETKSALRLTHSELISPECQSGADHLSNRDCEEARQIAALFSAYDIAVAPLIAKDRFIGVVFADNLYSNASIDADDVQLLDTLAQQAALTIDNALTYQALQDAQRELVSSEKLVAVGEMAARVSHEIRNPLATIGGFGHSILKKPDDENAVTRKARIIVSEVARLEELLTDLLDMARTRPLQFQPESINEIAEHALLLAEADIRSYNVQIEREFAPDLPMIYVDRARLLQAFLNTIRNGAQAMTDGGVLRVATRLTTEAPEATQNAETPREAIEIEITDSGSGIPERALKQVFDPFFSTKVSGSGLGLPVTRRIIEDHGGHIDVQSREGEGTTFIFRLPAVRADAEESSVHANINLMFGCQSGRFEDANLDAVAVSTKNRGVTTRGRLNCAKNREPTGAVRILHIIVQK